MNLRNIYDSRVDCANLIRRIPMSLNQAMEDTVWYSVDFTLRQEINSKVGRKIGRDMFILISAHLHDET